MKAKPRDDVRKILKRVQQRLDEKRSASGIALKVAKNGYSNDDDWLRVIVTPAAKGVRTYDYVETLSEVERELRQEGLDHVVLVPAIED